MPSTINRPTDFVEAVGEGHPLESVIARTRKPEPEKQNYWCGSLLGASVAFCSCGEHNKSKACLDAIDYLCLGGVKFVV